jgi:hypothetical protein
MDVPFLTVWLQVSCCVLHLSAYCIRYEDAAAPLMALMRSSQGTADYLPVTDLFNAMLERYREQSKGAFALKAMFEAGVAGEAMGGAVRLDVA